MNKGIVISTSRHTSEFLNDCLNSLAGTKYPILVVENLCVAFPNAIGLDISIVCNDWNGFELGGIRRGMERFDEFFYMPDTCVVKDLALIDYVFEQKESICLCDNFMSYIGKYRTETLKKAGVPKIHDKQMAVLMETYWCNTYLRLEPETKRIDPPIPVETDIFQEIHGEKRMVCGNESFIKYKGTYGGIF